MDRFSPLAWVRRLAALALIGAFFLPMVRGCGMEFSAVEVMKVLPESGPRGLLFRAGIFFPHFLALGLVLAEGLILRGGEAGARPAFNLLLGFALLEASLLIAAGVVLPLALEGGGRDVRRALQASGIVERVGMAFALGYPAAGAVWILLGRKGGASERLRRLGALCFGAVLLWYGAFILEGIVDARGRLADVGLDYLRWGFWLACCAALVIWVSLLDRK